MREVKQRESQVLEATESSSDDNAELSKSQGPSLLNEGCRGPHSFVPLQAPLLTSLFDFPKPPNLEGYYTKASLSTTIPALQSYSEQFWLQVPILSFSSLLTLFSYSNLCDFVWEMVIV